MAKKRAKPRPQTQQPIVENKDTQKLALGLLAVSYAIYVAWGILSNSTWDDDCATRYFRTLNAFRDPREFIYLWNRPLFVTIFSIPVALLGKIAIPILMSLISVAGAYFLYRTARLLQYQYALLVIPFLLFQPYFLGTGRDAMTEPMGATLIAWGLYAALSKRWLLFAILGALLPLARTELALLLPLWAYVLFREKQYLYILVLGLGVIVWNIAGWIIVGDPLFLYHETFGRAGEENRYGSQKFTTYFERYFYVLGPIVFYFFLLGFIAKIRKLDIKPLVLLQFIVGFLVYTLLAWKITIGQSAGFLRNLIPLSPLAALIAIGGFEFYVESVKKGKRIALMMFSCLALGALIIFLYPYEIDIHHVISSQKTFDYLSMSVVVGLTIVLSAGTVLHRFMQSRQARILAIICGVATVAYTLYTEPPGANMNAERAMINKLVGCYQDCGLEDAPKTFCSHYWFHWAGDYIPFREGGKFVSMSLDSLRKAPYESVIIWESHYANRLGNNINLSDLSDPNTYCLLATFYPEDATKVSYLYLKKRPEKSAMEYQDEMIMRNPKSPELLIQRANLYQAMNNTAKAMEDLDMALRVDTESNIVKMNYANFCLKIGKPQDAIAQSNAILENNKDFIPAMSIKGNAYFNLSNFPQAIKEFNEILEQDKDNKEAHYNIGVSYLRLNNKEEACKALLEAKKLNMENVDQLISQNCK